MSDFVNTGAVYKKKTRPDFDLSKKKRKKKTTHTSDKLMAEVSQMESMLSKLKKDVAVEQTKLATRRSARGTKKTKGSSLWSNSTTKYKTKSRYDIHNIENIPLHRAISSQSGRRSASRQSTKKKPRKKSTSERNATERPDIMGLTGTNVDARLKPRSVKHPKRQTNEFQPSSSYIQQYQSQTEKYMVEEPQLQEQYRTTEEPYIQQEIYQKVHEKPIVQMPTTKAPLPKRNNNPSSLLFAGTFDTVSGKASDSYGVDYANDEYETLQGYEEEKPISVRDKNASLNDHPLLQGEYDEREAHRSFQEALAEVRGTKQTVKTTIRPELENHPLLQGDYDEQASAASFQQALAAVRGTKKPVKTTIRPELENHPLLQGDYDEQASAASFQQALAAVRGTKQPVKTTIRPELENHPLLQGEYDESKNRQEFQKALAEARNPTKQKRRGFTKAYHETLSSCLYPTYFDKIAPLLH